MFALLQRWAMNEAKTEQEYESQPLKNFAMHMFALRETISLSSEFGHMHDSFVKCCNSYLLFCFCFNIQFCLIAIERTFPTPNKGYDVYKNSLFKFIL